MGHKVGTMACRQYPPGYTTINIERDEITPLLRRKIDYQPILDKHRWNAKIIMLSCFLIIGALIGLYLLLEQEQKLVFNVPFYMVERSVLNYAGPTVGLSTEITKNAGVLFLNTRYPQCTTKATCTDIIKSLIGLGVPVQHNFLIGGDGHVYEVLGWEHPSKQEDFMGNDSMITVGFMGDYTDKTPPKLMFDVAKALISESVRRRKLNTNYTVFGMRTKTVSDGEAMYQELAEWPRWKNLIDLKS